MSEKNTVDFEVDNVKYNVKLPGIKEQQEGQKHYNTAFSNAVQSKALLREKLNDFLVEQKIWNDEKEKEFLELRDDILDLEKKLKRGGIKVSEGKEISLLLRDKREKMRLLTSNRLALDNHTAQGQADNARFNYLVSACLVYNDNGKPVYKDINDYLEHSTSNIAIKAAEKLAELMYGLDDKFEYKLEENKFLSKFGFVDDKLRLINKEGKLVDLDGRLIDENGRLINERGQFININGDVVDENGDTIIDSKPFLDDNGNPVE